MNRILSNNIVPRLPVKSIARFRSVSKQLKLKEEPEQPAEKLLLFPKNESLMFTTLDCNQPQLGLPKSRPLPFAVTSIDQVVILCSLHGLVCVGIRNDGRYTNFIMWNPATGEYKNMSDSGSHSKCFDIEETAFGFYLSSSEDDYKLVCLTCEEGIYLYSLKANSWREVAASRGFTPPLPGWCMKPWTPSNWVNDKVYFLQNRPGNFFSDEPLSILSFDTITERLKEIKPPSFGGKHTSCPSVSVVGGGSLQIIVISQQPSVEIWRLNADEKWLKIVTYFPQQWFPSFPKCIRPLHVFLNGSWLAYDSSSCCFYMLDLNKRTSEICLLYDGSIPPRGHYIETLVSPNRFSE